MSGRDEVRPRPTGRATGPLWMTAYGAVLTAMAFSQAGGLMVADTKFDLLTAPLRFLSRGLRLWDPVASFGQVQNQAYGYAWPMGPFFALGHLLHLPMWAVQRGWWALLLCLAFYGVVRLAQELDLGNPLTQVAAGFLYVLTPRITTLLGSASVEIWPMALAPWVLLPLVRGSARGSVRRAAALSALAVATCGGVNAVAVAAALPLGVIWLLTRAPGPRRWRLLGWWVGLTVLATAWWSVPLVLLGKVSPPFLDYIENATITTIPTDLSRTLVGVSDWVAYFAGSDYPAGARLVSTPFLLLDAAAVAALGLVGVCLPRNPHRRFLALGVVTGLALVGLGYAGAVHGFDIGGRRHALDHALAPLRNLHKFDVVLRLPLVLGAAEALHRLPALVRGRGSVAAVRVLRVATALVVAGLLVPWLDGAIPAGGGVTAVPSYWSQTARYLAAEPRGTALVIPAAAFDISTWGNTHDDVLQGLATSPWAVRDVIPLAQPGNVTMLDAVTRWVESGRTGPQLATFLAANGIGRLVVRNDLDRLQTGAPDPAYVHSVLTASTGLSLAKSFGPLVGVPPYHLTSNGTRVVVAGGLSRRLPAVEVYDVAQPVSAALTEGADTLVGDPGAGLDSGDATGLADQPRVLAGDATGTEALAGQVLTDGLRRQESSFAAVRWNVSATMAADAPYRLVGPQHDRRLYADETRWQTTEAWDGVAGVSASSAASYADAQAPLQIGAHPGAVFDDDPATAWKSNPALDPTGQWWQVEFGASRTVGVLQVSIPKGSAAVLRLRITMGIHSETVAAPAPGRTRSYSLDLPPAAALRITAAGADVTTPSSFEISEVRLDGTQPQRYLVLPAPRSSSPVDTVALARDLDRDACVLVVGSFTCDDALVAPGEDGDTFARRFSLSTADSYQLTATASLRRGSVSVPAVERLLGARVSTDQPLGGDVATSPVAILDRDLATTWIASDTHPTVQLRLPRTETVRSIRLRLDPAAAASRPTRIHVSAGNGRSADVDLDADGRGSLPGWRTDRLTIEVTAVDDAYASGSDAGHPLPAGISGLRVNGAVPVSGAPDGLVDLACGSGPTLLMDGRAAQTSLTGSIRALLRGGSLPLQVCGGNVRTLGSGAHTLLARPTSALRVDTVELERGGATSAAMTPLDVRRDGHGDPVSLHLPARDEAGVVSLAQNLNAGWVARLDGKTLPVQRVDGWMQGWRVPAGAAGTLTLSYPIAHTFTIALVVGAALLLVVVLVASPLALRRRRRPEPAPLVPGRSGLLDLITVVVAGGLLAGWAGLGAVAVGLLAGAVVRRRGGTLLPAVAAGGAALAGALALCWPPVRDATWAASWSQWWSLATVGALVAVLVGARAAPEDA